MDKKTESQRGWYLAKDVQIKHDGAMFWRRQKAELKLLIAYSAVETIAPSSEIPPEKHNHIAVVAKFSWSSQFEIPMSPDQSLYSSVLDQIFGPVSNCQLVYSMWSILDWEDYRPKILGPLYIWKHCCQFPPPLPTLPPLSSLSKNVGLETQ